MEVKQGYEETEIGVIPEDWEVKKLGDCLSGTPDYGINAPAVPYTDSLPAYIRITDITDDGRFSSESLTSVEGADTERYFLNVGDLVFARTGASVGKSYLYDPGDGKLVFAGFLIRVQPNPTKLNPRFLAAYVTTGSYWNWVKAMSMRSGQPGINSTQYAQFPIHLPPLSEQQALATALSDVDALISALDKLIAKKRDIKQAAMQQLLTGKKRLPRFSGEWEAKKLGEVFTINAGKSKSKYVEESGQYLIVDMGAISTEGKLIARKQTDYSCDFLEYGDLVMPKDDIGGGNIIGRVAFIDQNKKYILGDHVYALRNIQGDALFLSYAINGHEINSSLRRKVSGSAQLGLGRQSVEEQNIVFPLLAEQKAIAAILSDMDAEISALERKRDKTRALKQGMMQELLTGRIRLT